MASNRVGGPTPAEPGKGQDTRTQAQQHRRIEKVEKVQKVDEVENEQTRKKFQSFMADEPEEESHAPSPFESDFYYTSSEDKSSNGETVVPSPAYSHPPDVNTAPTTEETGPSPLPRSHNFWSGTDSPPDHPPTKPEMRETSRSAIGKKETAKKEIGKGKKEEIEFFGPPGKIEISQTAKEAKARTIAEERKGERFAPPREIISPIEMRPGKIKVEEEKTAKKKEKEEVPTARYMREEEEKKVAPFTAPEKKREKVSPFAVPKEKEEFPTTRETKKGEKEPSPFTPRFEEKKETVSPQLSPHERETKPKALTRAQEKEERRGGKEKEKKGIPIEPPGTPTLPPNIIPIAQAATVQATPYLSPQIAPLFFQMVGTIYVMTSQGVSRTEIVLNAPSFANSKFYGATITIEKYATAPDSLNIRLTGSNEAVTTFNQNIPNLMTAFQNGKFGFRIGRIDAVYSIDRPVFRRKESGEQSKDFGEGGDFKDRKR